MQTEMPAARFEKTVRGDICCMPNAANENIFVLKHVMNPRLKGREKKGSDLGRKCNRFANVASPNFTPLSFPFVTFIFFVFVHRVLLRERQRDRDRERGAFVTEKTNAATIEHSSDGSYPRSLPPLLLSGHHLKSRRAVGLLRRHRPLLRDLIPPARTLTLAAGARGRESPGRRRRRRRVDDAFVGQLAAAQKLVGEAAAVHGLRVGVDALGDDLGLGREGEQLLDKVVHYKTRRTRKIPNQPILLLNFPTKRVNFERKKLIHH